MTQRQHSKGIAMLRDFLETVAAAEPHLLLTPRFRMVLAEALAATGQFEHALAVIERAIAERARSRASFDISEMLKIKAQILMSGPDPQPLLAEGQLRRARELAREQSALSWELRIAIDWLRIRQSDRTRLRTLQGVYAWFTQGFGTPDLDLALRVLEAEQHQEALAASCTPSQL